MGNFFKSLFSSSKAATPEEEKSKNDQKNFDILKYDGVRAQKIGQVAYAIFFIHFFIFLSSYALADR